MRLYNSLKFHVISGKSRKILRYGFKLRRSFLETVFEQRRRLIDARTRSRLDLLSE